MKIVDNLKVKLLGKAEKAIVKRHTKDIESYNNYLKGIYCMRIPSSEGFRQAFEYFQQSLQKDPNYAKAYVGLAFIPINSAFFGNIPPNKGYPNAISYLKKRLR